MSDANWPIKCPQCKKKKLERDYGVPIVPVIQDKTPKTVGQQAEANKKAMGNEQWQKKRDELLGEKGRQQQATPTPWWRPEGSKPLDVTKIKDVQKYIETGEK
jgi:hypothetical protein